MNTKELHDDLARMVALMKGKGLTDCRAYIGMAAGKDSYGPFVSVQCAEKISPKADEYLQDQRHFPCTDFAHGIAQAQEWIATYEAPKADVTE